MASCYERGFDMVKITSMLDDFIMKMNSEFLELDYSGITEKRPLDIQYRNNAGYIIPYIEIKLDKFTLNYASFGPLQCDDAQKEVQKVILKELLYNGG